MTILGKKQMSEEDIKLNYITPVILDGWKGHVTMETKITDGRINISGNEQGCNIDLCGYPHEEEEVLDPLDTIREYQERRTALNAEIDKVLAELEALLPGGVKE